MRYELKCGYEFKNGGLKAKEVCPKSEGGCGAINFFIPVS